MGWAYGIVKGRKVGYSVSAKCDHPGCKAKIDRGLAYACGGEHGDTERGCAGYFCEKHRSNLLQTAQGDLVHICDECARIILRDNPDMWLDPEEDVICARPNTKVCHGQSPLA